MKESFNGPEFLGQKFQDIHTSEDVRTLAEYTTKKEGLIPKQSKLATIDRYLRGLDRIVNNRSSVTGLIEESVIDDYVLDVTDVELVQSIARDLCESEMKIAINQGRGGDIEQLDYDQVIERYKESVIEKAKIQRRSLSTWLSYLKESEDYPMWFKYFAVRSLKKMGQFSRDSTSYSTRTENTIAPFPEMNAEALAFVYQSLIGNLEKESLPINEERKEELNKELEKRLASKDFAKLYAFAQVECAGNLDRESLEGEWVMYPQGSDYKELEKGLKGKGTGWCTAAGSAEWQLKNGDFHVFYTKNKAGIPTEPRIAIRMENRSGVQSIVEIRGVNRGQAMEPELIDTAKEYYSNLNGAEKYEKADNDMKYLTDLYAKSFEIDKDTKEKKYLSPKLDKLELRFLYEIDTPIKGFGHEKDPRIEEILSARKFRLNEDISTALDCSTQDVPSVFYDGYIMRPDIVSPKIVTGNFNLDNTQKGLKPAKDYVFPENVGGVFRAEFTSMDGAILPKRVGDLNLNSLKSSKGMFLPEMISLPEQDVGITLNQEERSMHALLGCDEINEDTKALLYNGIFPGHRNGGKPNVVNCLAMFPPDHSMKIIRIDGVTPKPIDAQISCHTIETESEICENINIPFWLLEVQNIGSGYDDLIFSQDDILKKITLLGLRTLKYDSMIIMLQSNNHIYEGMVFVVESGNAETPLSYFRVTKGHTKKIEELEFGDQLVCGFNKTGNARTFKMSKGEPLTDAPFERFFDAQEK